MLNNSEFEFIVNRKPGADAWEIYLVERNGIETYQYNVGKDGRLIVTKITDVIQDNAPLMYIPSRLWEEFVRAINKDLPNVQRDEIDAELKATKFHLEDMRSLVFKKETIGWVDISKGDD